MTNEEVLRRAHEEFALRGLSPNTVDEYIRAFRLFLRHYENRPIEIMGEVEIRDFFALSDQPWKGNRQCKYLQQRSAVYLWRRTATESQSSDDSKTPRSSRTSLNYE